MKLPCLVLAVARGLVATCLGLASLSAAAQASASESKLFVAQQQDFVARIAQCPAPVDAFIRQKMSNPAALPEHLRPALTQIYSNPASMMKGLQDLPPDVQEKLKGMAAQMGMTRDQMLATMKQNMPKSVGAPPPTFMSKASGSITLTNDIKDICNADCERVIDQNIVLAIAFWKNACHLCRDDFMAFLQTGSGVFVDARVAKWLSGGKPELGRYPLPGNNSSVFERNSAMPKPGSPSNPARPADDMLAFERLDPAMAQRVCEVPTQGAKRPRSLESLQQLVCSKAQVPVERTHAKLSVRLMPVETSCGPARSFLGCGHTDDRVEISFAEVSHAFLRPGSTGTLVVGKRDREVVSGTNVLVHEVGHWFGLPHINYFPKEMDVPDIMQDTLEEKPCASELSLMLLNNMAEQSHQDRFRAGGALKRKLKSR